jgi:hypothetical protein
MDEECTEDRTIWAWTLDEVSFHELLDLVYDLLVTRRDFRTLVEFHEFSVIEITDRVRIRTGGGHTMWITGRNFRDVYNAALDLEHPTIGEITRRTRLYNVSYAAALMDAALRLRQDRLHRKKAGVDGGHVAA